MGSASVPLVAILLFLSFEVRGVHPFVVNPLVDEALLLLRFGSVLGVAHDLKVLEVLKFAHKHVSRVPHDRALA